MKGNQMKHTFLIKINVDIAKVSDAYTALELVDGADIESFEPVVNNKKQEPAKQAKAKKHKAKKLNSQGKYMHGRNGRTTAHSLLDSDPRCAHTGVITRSGWRQVDTEATLKNLGLTMDQLMAMRTKLGTLEHALKKSILLRRVRKQSLA